MKKGNFRKSKRIHFAIENLKRIEFLGVDQNLSKQLVYQNSRYKNEGICKKKKKIFLKTFKSDGKKIEKTLLQFFFQTFALRPSDFSTLDLS